IFASTGVRRASSSKRSSVKVNHARRARAIRWTIELVGPPRASTDVIALSKDLSLHKSEGFKSPQTISTILFPVSEAYCAWRESTAGIDENPGNVKPSASAALVIVEAVPIVMQWPADRAMPVSMPFHSIFVIFPAFNSAAYFHVSVPLPRTRPFQLPRSIGPAGK